MIRKTLTILRKQRNTRVYSRVVAEDTKDVSRLLKKAAKKANEDQRQLVSQP